MKEIKKLIQIFIQKIQICQNKIESFEEQIQNNQFNLIMKKVGKKNIPKKRKIKKLKKFLKKQKKIILKPKNQS